MADVESKAKIVVSAEDKTGGVFQKLGSQMKEMSGNTKSLTSGLVNLGLAGAGLYAIKKGFDFIGDSIKASNEAQAEMAQVSVNIKNAGLEVDKVIPKYKEWGAAAVQLGFNDEQAMLAASRFAGVTKDLSKQHDLLNLAMDLSRSKNMDLGSATTTLMSVTAGNVRVLKQYGIELSSTATATDALDALNKKVTGSAAAFADTTAGKMAIMQVTFTNFKETIGDTFGPALNIALTNFNNFLQAANTNAASASTSMAQKLAIIVNPDAWKLTAKTVMAPLVEASRDFNNLWIGGINMLGGGITPLASTIPQSVKDITELGKKVAATTDAALKLQGVTITPPGGGPDFSCLGKGAADAADAAKKAADAFKEFSSKVVDGLDAQQKAIGDLRDQLAQLNRDLDDSVNKQNDTYQQDVISAARSAKTKMDDLDKQMATEKAARGEGWRSKVADLQAEKDKQQQIINEAGGVVDNINAELSKDELTILKEKHEKELGAIYNQAEEKRKEYEAEIKARTDFVNTMNALVVSPDFYAKAVTQGESFLGAIGGSDMQQQLIFNFNNVVAGDDGIKKVINDTIKELDRQATLKKVGGK